MPNIVINTLLKYYSKNVFVEEVLPVNLALFIYVSTYYAETVN